MAKKIPESEVRNDYDITIKAYVKDNVANVETTGNPTVLFATALQILLNSMEDMDPKLIEIYADGALQDIIAQTAMLKPQKKGGKKSGKATTY